jgi:hypothetical protein
MDLRIHLDGAEHKLTKALFFDLKLDDYTLFE